MKAGAGSNAANALASVGKCPDGAGNGQQGARRDGRVTRQTLSTPSKPNQGDLLTGEPALML